jgi:hypothetical protein
MAGMGMALPCLVVSRVAMRGQGVGGDQGTVEDQCNSNLGPNTI